MSSNEYIDLIIYLSTDWRPSSADTKGYLFGDVPFIRALSKLPRVRILYPKLSDFKTTTEVTELIYKRKNLLFSVFSLAEAN